MVRVLPPSCSWTAEAGGRPDFNESSTLSRISSSEPFWRIHVGCGYSVSDAALRNCMGNDFELRLALVPGCLRGTRSLAR